MPFGVIIHHSQRRPMRDACAFSPSLHLHPLLLRASMLVGGGRIFPFPSPPSTLPGANDPARRSNLFQVPYRPWIIAIIVSASGFGNDGKAS
jgi:hypothetical protein